MNDAIHVLCYTLPSKDPNSYAESALKILQEIEDKVPDTLKVMLRSDVVLTLSGVRSLTTYVDFPNISQKTVHLLVDLLKQFQISLFKEDSALIEPESNVENWIMIHQEEFLNLGAQYDIGLFPKLKKVIDNDDELAIWSMWIQGRLADFIDKNKDKLSPNLTNDQWAAHNLRFGMLLGYPGEAIISGCSLSDLDKEHSAHIRYHDNYEAAWPIYSYGDDAVDNPSIISHQKLWSDILTKVYESGWHLSYASAVS